jgi:hypothetical protein
MPSQGRGSEAFPETLTTAYVSGNMPCMSFTVSGSSATTSRVRRHRATAGMVRVEVEVPTQEDALAVRRFAQARRRSRETVPIPTDDTSSGSSATTSDDLAATLAGMEPMRQAIALQFGQALAGATDPDMLARGRRVALNFVDAVARRGREVALRGDDRVS